MEYGEAGAALDAVRNTNIRLAKKSHWSFGRHAAYGVLQAVIVFSVALPGDWMFAGFAVALAMMVLIIAQDKRRDGVFVAGFEGRKTRAALIAALAVLFGAVAVVFTLRDAGLFSWPVIGATMFTLVGSTMASIWWECLYRAELQEEQA